MSYIFVGGSQRSGTSLLAASLCAGEETNPYLGESGGLRSLFQSYSVMSQRFNDETVFHFGSRAVFDEYCASNIRSFLSHVLAAHAPASSLVLKEPHLTVHFPTLWQYVPEARFVMLIRDPRDIVASMLTVGEKMRQKGQAHLFSSGKVDKIAQLVRQFYRPVFQASLANKAFAKTVTWVRYESLVEDPVATIEALRAFTGLKLELYDPTEPTKRTHPAKVKSRGDSKRAGPWRTELMQQQKGVSTASRGRFESVLTADQIRTVEKTVPGIFERFDYPLFEG